MTENIRVNVHSSIRIDTGAGRVYVDPFKIDEACHDAAFILITHDHFDHFSPEDIEKVAGADTVLVVPESMAAKAREASGAVKRIETVSPGEAYSVSGLKFETVPSYNALKHFHPKSARWVGYIIVSEGERIYVAGDTDATGEAKDVRCDIALVPVGGTYTMNAKEAAGLVNAIRPKVAIPVHYGSIVGDAKDGEIFASCVDSDIKVELKMKG